MAEIVKLVNPDIANYLKALNTVMQDEYGIRYIEVMKDLHDDNETWKSGFENGVSPQELARNIALQSGFMSVKAAEEVVGQQMARSGYDNIDKAREIASSHASKHNAYQAALLSFASTTPGWSRGLDGRVFQSYADGVAELKAEFRSDSNLWGYVVEVKEGATLRDDGAKLISDGNQVARLQGWDLGQTANRFVEYLEMNIDSEYSAPKFA